MVFIILATFGFLSVYTGRIPNLSIIKSPRIEKIHISEIIINAEVADSADARKKGLGGRENLPANSGMLFIFPKADYFNFWMKGMKFPIDIIWIEDNKIVSITKNVPAPETGTVDADLPIYTSSEPIDSALEVNAGFSDLHDIKIGDRITK